MHVPIKSASLKYCLSTPLMVPLFTCYYTTCECMPWGGGGHLALVRAARLITAEASTFIFKHKFGFMSATKIPTQQVLQ